MFVIVFVCVFSLLVCLDLKVVVVVFFCLVCCFMDFWIFCFGWWFWLIYSFSPKWVIFCICYQLKFNSQWNVWSLQMQHATMINKTYSISPRLCHLISIKRWMFRKRYTIGHSSYTYTVQYKRLSHSSHNE